MVVDEAFGAAAMADIAVGLGGSWAIAVGQTGRAMSMRRAKGGGLHALIVRNVSVVEGDVHTFRK